VFLVSSSNSSKWATRLQGSRVYPLNPMGPRAFVLPIGREGDSLTDARDSAAAAEAEAFRLAESIGDLLHQASAPSRLSGPHLVEQLSFLQLRENFRCFLELCASGRDVPAAHLARALFEESARWSWADEDIETRREAFLNESSRSRHLIAKAAEEQGIDASPLFGKMVESVVPAYEEGAIRFPKFEELFSWSPDLRKMMYLQYRVLSQYTHSTVLSAASAVDEVGDELVNHMRLPIAARLLVLRNACASVGFVFDFCRAGLDWPGREFGYALNFQIIGTARQIADIAYPHSPGTA
jgi:hypothetical protein